MYRQVTRSIGFLLCTVMCAFVFLIEPAHALEVTSSAVDHLDKADLQVSLSADDATGTVVLTVNGRTVGARSALPGEQIDFGLIPLAAGNAKAIATLRSRGDVVSSEPFRFRMWDTPKAATLVAPAGFAARYTATAVQVGFSTTMLSMYVNGKLVKTRAVRENTLASMGRIELREGANTVEFVASNPLASTKSSFTIRRLDYPWPTCIIIDKSDFRLHWIRDGALVKSYPIAIGKPNTPTPNAIWRIDAKYHTSPLGVYGPRKMRLFRRVSSGYTYTAYGIHGTNQEWVIGTMASHGCIRMYNKDVLELFPQVPLGTMVQTRP